MKQWDKAAVYQLLTERGIWHEITEHPAVYNMEEMAAVDLPYPEADGKNLFVRDDKKRQYYLITVRGDKRVDLKAFRQANHTRPLSFASAEDLQAKLGLLPGAQVALQIGPEQAGVLAGGLQVQLVPAGLHGEVQLLHRRPVVLVGLDREAVPLHRDGPLRAHPAGVGVEQRQGPVGAQQDHVAHKNTPPSPPRWAGPGPPGATISISIGGDNIYFLFIPIPIPLSLPFPITAPLVVRKGATIRAILSRGKEMMHCDGKNRRSEERVYPLL